MQQSKRFNSLLHNERKLALEKARLLTRRILKRRKGKHIDLSQVIGQIREERINELTKTH